MRLEKKNPLSIILSSPSKPRGNGQITMANHTLTGGIWGISIRIQRLGLDEGITSERSPLAGLSMLSGVPSSPQLLSQPHELLRESLLVGGPQPADVPGDHPHAQLHAGIRPSKSVTLPSSKRSQQSSLQSRSNSSLVRPACLSMALRVPLAISLWSGIVSLARVSK